LLAGCSDDPAATSDGGANEEPAADDPRTDDERAADEAAAETMVLTLSDFPPGWESTPAEEDEPDERFDEQLAECLGVDVSEIDPNNPKAGSPNFASSNGDQVTSQVAFTPTVEDATDALALRRQEGANECYAESFLAIIEDFLANPEEGEEAPDDFEVGEPTVNEMSFGALGDESIAFRVTLPLEADGFSAEFYLDVVNVRVGRVGVSTTFQSVLTPFDTEEAARLTGVVVDRVNAGTT
jgi:hypothetical protein